MTKEKITRSELKEKRTANLKVFVPLNMVQVRQENLT